MLTVASAPSWFDLTTLSIGTVAAAVAIWQLALQRAEVQRSALVTTLVQLHTATAVEINHLERVISDLKEMNRDWRDITRKVNDDLRPLHLRLTGCVAEVMKAPPRSRSFRSLAKRIKGEEIPHATTVLRATFKHR